MPAGTLEELAAAEAEIEQIVASLEGTMEEKAAHLEAVGIFRRYTEIFAAYLSLAEPPPSELEALKRAAFLAWYEVTEPACFSGISGLPVDARARIIALIEPLVPHLDAEFRWMLAYYFRIADYTFPDLGQHSLLRALLDEEDPDAWLAQRASPDSMVGRGLMGEYWISVFRSSAA